MKWRAREPPKTIADFLIPKYPEVTIIVSVKIIPRIKSIHNIV
jgi:hypothetical protein